MENEQFRRILVAHWAGEDKANKGRWIKLWVCGGYYTYTTDHGGGFLLGKVPLSVAMQRMVDAAAVHGLKRQMVLSEER